MPKGNEAEVSLDIVDAVVLLQLVTAIRDIAPD